MELFFFRLQGKTMIGKKRIGCCFFCESSLFHLGTRENKSFCNGSHLNSWVWLKVSFSLRRLVGEKL